jgi:hypothetical protein
MGRSDSFDFLPHGVQLMQSITVTYFGIVTKQSGENTNTWKTIKNIILLHFKACPHMASLMVTLTTMG